MTKTLQRVDAGVSDLFFNTDLSGTKVYEGGDFSHFDEEKLKAEADIFAATIKRISNGALDYTAEEIIADFYARI